MTATLRKTRFTFLVSCFDELAVHSRSVTRRGEVPPRKFFDPTGKMCRTQFKTIGHSSKFGPLQKTLRPVVSQAMVTGLLHSCTFLCLQRQVAKLANGLFYFWFLSFRNNRLATNLQSFTLILPHVTVQRRHFGR